MFIIKPSIHNPCICRSRCIDIGIDGEMFVSLPGNGPTKMNSVDSSDQTVSLFPWQGRRADRHDWVRLLSQLAELFPSPQLQVFPNEEVHVFKGTI